MNATDINDVVLSLDVQIAELQRKRDEIKAEIRADAIAHIKGIMAAHGLTVADLAENRNRVVKVADPLPRVNGKAPVKFADGKGNTWTGRGQVPRWIRDAYVNTPAQIKVSLREFAERFRIVGAA